MNRVDIYYFELKKDVIIQINALIEKGALISLFYIDENFAKNCNNEKITRLIRAYGEKVFPVVLVNGEVAFAEVDFDINDIIGYLELNRTEMQQLKILNSCCGCNKTNGCDRHTGCTGCSGCTGCNKGGGSNNCCNK